MRSTLMGLGGRLSCAPQPPDTPVQRDVIPIRNLAFESLELHEDLREPEREFLAFVLLRERRSAFPLTYA